MTHDQSPKMPTRADYERALASMNSFIDIEVGDLMTLAERARHFATQRETESLGVARLMTQPVRTVTAQTTMSEAAHLMASERISGLPVTDEAGHLVGIITEADFLRGLGVPAHHPTQTLWQHLEALFNHLAHHVELEGPQDPVADHMVRDVVCAAPNQCIDEVVELMKRHRVKRVVVCDDRRQVVGMLTRSDLMRIFFDRYRQASAAE